MNKAVALSCRIAERNSQVLRMAVVYGCALALIAAGPALPI